MGAKPSLIRSSRGDARLGTLAVALALGLLAASGAAAKTGPCKDANGKFVKCSAAGAVAPAAAAKTVAAATPAKASPAPAAAPPAAPAAAAPAKSGGLAAVFGRCKDANGKFVKCPPKATSGVATAAASAPAASAARSAPAATPASAAVARIGAPAGSTARCKDGSFSASKTHSGACSRHGGVAAWL